MKTVELNDSQLKEVCKALDTVEDGEIEIELEVDNLLLVITGFLYTEGYVEDDFRCGYMNGTGAYIETEREAELDMAVKFYDEDGNAEPANATMSDINKINNYIRNISHG